MKCVYSVLIFCMSFLISHSQEDTLSTSHYVFPEFTRGTVLLKTGILYDALLNYNRLSEEMIFDNKGIKLAIAKDELKLVDTVFIRDKKFFKLNNIFVELICHSTFDLYAEHKCKLNSLGKPSAYGGTSQTAASSSASSFYSGVNFYELKLPDRYETSKYTYYWLNKHGELHRFINMKQLMKYYDTKKDLFKVYVKTHDVEFENGASIGLLISYLESN